ncbi:MAG: DNA methylase [Clostridia bacterium]|nr:DNA methylase [Clostridia bacterium]
MERQYIAIDLKSFYASVECIDRGLDPLATHLVVADESRTDKTICLAVSPSLKACGVSSRPRLFEAIQQVREANARRRMQAPGQRFTGASWDAKVLAAHPETAIDFIKAPPRMARYIECSNRIYEVYLKYVAPEDIHVYSIDEVFMDVTPYLMAARQTAREFAMTIIRDVLSVTGITATAGIGTNLYLAKVAMDIVAKRSPPDAQGVRIAELDEMSYRHLLWAHQPLTDFWRVGGGYARKLARYNMFTMGDIARCSVGKPGSYFSEDLLYKLFGVNAELLIDHAWGWEPCTIGEIKAYQPVSHSLSTGQVLPGPYAFDKARLIVQEMTDLLTLDLVDKGLMTDQMVLVLGYDVESLADPKIRQVYTGAVVLDHYGRAVPRHAHGTANLPRMTSSTRQITETVLALYDRIADPLLLVRRINVVAARVLPEKEALQRPPFEQLDLFTDYEAAEQRRQLEDAQLARERRCQRAVLGIRRRFGKNAILMGMNFQEGGTAIERNRQIGGHKA